MAFSIVPAKKFLLEKGSLAESFI